MQITEKKPKRRWGAALLSWLVAFFLLVLVADLYTNIQYELLNSKIGANLRPTNIFAPWWANVIFFAVCGYTGKRFLFPKNEEEKEE